MDLTGPLQLLLEFENRALGRLGLDPVAIHVGIEFVGGDVVDLLDIAAQPMCEHPYQTIERRNTDDVAAPLPGRLDGIGDLPFDVGLANLPSQLIV